MDELLTELNSWVASHQSILAVVGIPLLVALSTCVVALQTTRMGLKANQLDRQLQARIWDLEHRKQRLLELRKLLSDFSATTFEADFDMGQGLSSGNPNRVLKDKAIDTTNKLILLLSEANLMLGFDDEEYKDLSEAMWFEIKLLSVSMNQEKRSLELKKRKPDERFASISARVMKRLEANLIADGKNLSIAR